MRIVALISGSGTTLQNLLDRGYPIVGVVASRAGIVGIDRAETAKIPVKIVTQSRIEKGPKPEGCPTDPTFSTRVFAAIRDWKPDLVCLCGWLKLLSIPKDFENRVLNIHPSLLPAFGGSGMYGRKVHEAVIASGAKVSGCTVHFADNCYDTGPILVQKTVPVLDEDSPESLAARVFEAECTAYPAAIDLVASGRLRIEGRRVINT